MKKCWNAEQGFLKECSFTISLKNVQFEQRLEVDNVKGTNIDQ